MALRVSRGADRPYSCFPAPCRCVPAAVVPANFALPKQDIVALAQATPSLSTLVTAVSAAGLVSALQAR